MSGSEFSRTFKNEGNIPLRSQMVSPKLSTVHLSNLSGDVMDKKYSRTLKNKK